MYICIILRMSKYKFYKILTKIQLPNALTH